MRLKGHLWSQITCFKSWLHWLCDVAGDFSFSFLSSLFSLWTSSGFSLSLYRLEERVLTAPTSFIGRNETIHAKLLVPRRAQRQHPAFFQILDVRLDFLASEVRYGRTAPALICSSREDRPF